MIKSLILYVYEIARLWTQIQKKFGLSVEEADVWRVYIRGYVDENSDTLVWTEMELQCKYSKRSVFFYSFCFNRHVANSSKTHVKLNGVMMWLVYANSLNALGCQWGICYVKLRRLCAVFKKSKHFQSLKIKCNSD